MAKLFLAIVSVVVLAAALFVGTSVMGRGARAAIGEPQRATSGEPSVEYYAQGAGESVVLIASLARPASDFNELATALVREGFRTLAIESRGIGGTGGGGPFVRPTLHDFAEDVEAMLRHAGLPATERVHVVGHAFGNRVARTYASDRPERTRSVTLIAAGGGAPIPQRIQRALLASTWSFLPWWLRGPELRVGFFSGDNEIPDYWRVGWSYWSAVAQIHAARATPSEEFWSGGPAPMLVIQGDDDTIAPPEDAGLPLRAQFPDRVTLVRVPGAGHALLPEQPAIIEASLVAFLRQQRSTP